MCPDEELSLPVRQLSYRVRIPDLFKQTLTHFSDNWSFGREASTRCKGGVTETFHRRGSKIGLTKGQFIENALKKV
jgi:hypothetical protein